MGRPPLQAPLTSATRPDPGSRTEVQEQLSTPQGLLPLSTLDSADSLPRALQTVPASCPQWKPGSLCPLLLQGAWPVPKPSCLQHRRLSVLRAWEGVPCGKASSQSRPGQAPRLPAGAWPRSLSLPALSCLDPILSLPSAHPRVGSSAGGPWTRVQSGLSWCSASHGACICCASSPPRRDPVPTLRRALTSPDVVTRTCTCVCPSARQPREEPAWSSSRGTLGARSWPWGAPWRNVGCGPLGFRLQVRL